MPRPVMCDMGHDEQVLAVYMVTELESGDVVALCGHCMLDLAAGMLRGAGAIVVRPGDRDAIDDPESLTEPPETSRGFGSPEPPPEPEAPPSDPGQVTTSSLHEERQRAKARRKLATRPDSATTSERDVPWPETSAATD